MDLNTPTTPSNESIPKLPVRATDAVVALPLPDVVVENLPARDWILIPSGSKKKTTIISDPENREYTLRPERPGTGRCIKRCGATIKQTVFDEENPTFIVTKPHYPECPIGEGAVMRRRIKVESYRQMAANVADKNGKSARAIVTAVLNEVRIEQLLQVCIFFFF